MTYAVKYYYTSRHPEKGDIPFFTPKELISLAEESRYNSDNQDYDEITTVDEAISYLEHEEGYGTFHETTQYLSEDDFIVFDSDAATNDSREAFTKKLEAIQFANEKVREFILRYNKDNEEEGAVADIEDLLEKGIQHLSIGSKLQDYIDDEVVEWCIRYEIPPIEGTFPYHMELIVSAENGIVSEIVFNDYVLLINQ